MNAKYLTALVLLGFILGQTSLYARAVRIWSYDDLLKASDVVAIVEPIKSENNQDQFFELSSDDRGLAHGVSTTFKIHCYLKGASSTTEIVVKHFDGKDVRTLVNAPDLVYFPIGPQTFDVSAPQNNQVHERYSTSTSPLWLAFLKRNDDGTLAPTAGQMDSVLSFRWLANYVPGTLEQFQ
jgi:hypothetical protein